MIYLLLITIFIALLNEYYEFNRNFLLTLVIVSLTMSVLGCGWYVLT